MHWCLAILLRVLSKIKKYNFYAFYSHCIATEVIASVFELQLDPKIVKLTSILAEYAEITIDFEILDASGDM